MIRIWRKFKASQYGKIFSKLKQELQDQKLNRQMIGIDRFNNKYYQYYSYYGLPTRRQIHFRDPHDFAMKDLVYYRWLHNMQFDPPSDHQKQQFYLEQQKRYQLARQADQKQQRIMLEFRRQRQQLLLRDKAIYQLQQQLKNTPNQIQDIKTKRQV